jgi:hypothetical protein
MESTTGDSRKLQTEKNDNREQPGTVAADVLAIGSRTLAVRGLQLLRCPMASLSFSVRVVDSDGKPRKGVKVGYDFGLVDGADSAYTDSDGWATLHFSPAGGGVSGVGEIYVEGESQGRHTVEDGDTLSFTVDYD